MRLSGVLILVVLLAMAMVVYLQSRDVAATRDAVTVIATQLKEEGVDARAFDRFQAREVIAVLEGLVADPSSIPDHLEDLKTIASTAAGWAAGALSPSPELHASVAIRKAAVELRSHGVNPSERKLKNASYELRRARHALSSPTSGGVDGSSAPSGLVTEGVQDRLHNLEAAQKERALELEEELGP
ncbi:MAG: hypothetical protein V2I67_04555 [Thermoanaerobaculales bacterium]|jgi:hypothetical protein|nr:hypothetical protein [Thermoanaerobaculales bacterium]